MSNRIPTKANVNIASVKPNKFDLSCKHITTSDFGLLRPVYSRMMVPADKFEVEVNSFHRLDPMVAPNNSDMNVHTRAFFVPFRTFVANFNEFIANTPSVTSNGLTQNIKIPTFTSRAILTALKNESLSTVVAYDNAGDIVFRNNVSKTWLKIKLTTRGRAFYNLLLSLGYNFRFDPINDADLDHFEYSALPLLSYLKVWIDWYVPSRFYFTDKTILALQKLLALKINNFLSADDLVTISKALCVFFTEDYFCNCLSQPFGDNVPNVRPNVSTSTPDGSSLAVTVDSLKDGAFVSSNGDAITQFNALSIKSLGAIQAMLNRNAIVNQKLKDYIKINYGLEPNLDTLNMSHYLGSSYDQLLVGDVMSNADTLNASGTSGALLGQYAGKGLGSSNAKFSCHATEFGMFLVLQDITPQPFYYQGVHTEHTAKLRYDFFDPTFDGVITEAVPYSRLDNTCHDDKLLTPQANTIFGYMPVYSDYKVGYDILSGNFRMASINTGLDSWYLARQFGDLFKTEHISLGFCDASILNSANKFATLFYTDNSSADHIYQVHNIRVTAFRRMRSLIEQVLDDDSEHNGSVTIDRMGTIADRN